MTVLDQIKNKIRHLYETNPNIHVNISFSHTKIKLKHDPVRITGVYRHVFRIEETSSGEPKSHTLQYVDILTGQIEIVELNQ